MKKFGLLVSGGSAPGVNALIRSVVRAGENKRAAIYGFNNGFKGLVENNQRLLERADTANIISLGGTIIHTSRYEEFKNASTREKAADTVKKLGLDGLIVCGGEGTMEGAYHLAKESNIPIIGIPVTIDNDVYGTENSIGFDTAVNIAVNAIDKIRDTADSHGQVFMIEVMGRTTGFIAMHVGIATGAEFIAIPETMTDVAMIYRHIATVGKGRRTIVVISEGDESGGAVALSNLLMECYKIESKVAILGHLQRGGSPSTSDRVLAARFGEAAIDSLTSGRKDVAVGERAGNLEYTPLYEAFSRKKQLPNWMISLSELLM